ncbi:granule-bound starch synthase [Carex littledalei]|uniref:Granule-bound starch synthase n=1 Tax=Carex littledalei TaxID=544730 RepID=A0A833VXQ5_9POAL|nr:granule-bound starch synthase [Carex littledalei]
MQMIYLSSILTIIWVVNSGFIEDQGYEAFEVDFANKYLGGGALSRGCVQSYQLLGAGFFFPERSSGFNAVDGDVGDKNETVHCFHCHESGVNRVFVDNPMFLQKAALEAPRLLKFRNQNFSGPYDLLPSMDPIRMAAARMSISGPSSARQLPVRRASTASSYLVKITNDEITPVDFVPIQSDHVIDDGKGSGDL